MPPQIGHPCGGDGGKEVLRLRSRRARATAPRSSAALAAQMAPRERRFDVSGLQSQIALLGRICPRDKVLGPAGCSVEPVRDGEVNVLRAKDVSRGVGHDVARESSPCGNCFVCAKRRSPRSHAALSGSSAVSKMQLLNLRCRRTCYSPGWGPLAVKHRPPWQRTSTRSPTFVTSARADFSL